LGAGLTSDTAFFGVGAAFAALTAPAADFFVAGAAALDAGATVIFLAGVVTVFFGAGALAFAGVLAMGLTGATVFLAGATGALAALAVLALDVATGLVDVPGLAFLVLVAFNSCLLIETQGARLREFQVSTRRCGVPP
jgi:hypothetical protein